MFLNMIKIKDLQIQKVQQTLSRINTKETKTKQNTIKLLESSDKDKNLNINHRRRQIT